VADATKQLITVATGVITVTVIFSKDLTTWSRSLALLAWITLLASVFCGVLVLFNMGGLLDALAKGKDANKTNDAGKNPKKTKGDAEEGIRESGNLLLSQTQVGAFMVGMLLMLFFGFFAVRGSGSSDGNKAAVTVTCVAPPAPQAVTVTCVTPPPSPTLKRHCWKDKRKKKLKRRGEKEGPVAATS
jgi:amino acid transporter